MIFGIRTAEPRLTGPCASLVRNLPRLRARGQCALENVSSENFARDPTGAADRLAGPHDVAR